MPEEAFVEDQLDDLGDEQVEPVDEVTEAELDFLDIDQYADKYVVVRVDGEDVEVPLKETLAGYQRQADYTRKTQELADQRKELAWATAIKGALDQDPVTTLQLLAEQYGVQFARDVQAAHEAPNDDPFDFGGWDDEPTGNQPDPKYADLEARIQRFEAAQAEQQLNATLGALASKYGEDFDPVEVVSAAMASGSTDLEATYKLIAFDRIQASNRKTAANQAKAEQRTAAKREASVVAGGSGAGGGSVDTGNINSVAEAWAAAKRQLSN